MKIKEIQGEYVQNSFLNVDEMHKCKKIISYKIKYFFKIKGNDNCCLFF